MANFYTDNTDLKHHLNHPLMRKIVELKERNYTDAEKFDYAPFNFEDAMDSYDKVLEIVGKYFENNISLKRAKSGKGSMTIHFSSDEEVQKFLKALEDSKF